MLAPLPEPDMNVPMPVAMGTERPSVVMYVTYFDIDVRKSAHDVIGSALRHALRCTAPIGPAQLVPVARQSK